MPGGVLKTPQVSKVGDDTIFSGSIERGKSCIFEESDGELKLVELREGPADNEIWYTTLHGNTIKYKGYEYEVISNTYESGKGVIKFNEPLTISKLCGWPNSGSGGEGGSFEDAANSYYSPVNDDELITLSLPNIESDSILYRTFANNKYLRQINIPEGISVLGAYVFQDCESLESITIPSTVKEFGETLRVEINPETQEVRPKYMCGTFNGCYFTKEKFINKSSLDAETNNYWGATIVDVEQEDGLLIKNNIVIKCRLFSTSATIPNSVTSIGSSAFSGCSSLISITYEGTVEEWAAVTKGDDWNRKVPATYVHCTDGDVIISATN